MKKYAKNLGLTFFLLSALVVTSNVYVANAISTVDAQKVDSLRQQKIAKQIDEYLKAKQFNGTVLIAKDGKMILTKGYGQANFTTKAPNDKDTIYRIGSVTKTFTATAIMQLAEKGKLKLDDPVSKFIPDFPSGDKITIHHLLSNSSGLGDYFTPEFLEDPTKTSKYVSLEEIVELAKTMNLEFEPGSKKLYSNAGYAMLGYIVERVSHMTWDNYVNEYFFKPLNMNRSGVDINNPVAPNHAVGTGILADKNIDMSYFGPAGGLYSTVGDLYKFNQAFLSGKLISQQSLEKMFTPVVSGYGYGWEDGKNLSLSSDWKMHSGHIPGFISYNAVNQKNNMQVIMLTNKGPFSPEEFEKLEQLKKQLTEISSGLTRN